MLIIIKNDMKPIKEYKSWERHECQIKKWNYIQKMGGVDKHFVWLWLNSVQTLITALQALPGPCIPGSINTDDSEGFAAAIKHDWFMLFPTQNSTNFIRIHFSPASTPPRPLRNIPPQPLQCQLVEGWASYALSGANRATTYVGTSRPQWSRRQTGYRNASKLIQDSPCAWTEVAEFLLITVVYKWSSQLWSCYAR